jgi:hypothetical protein
MKSQIKKFCSRQTWSHFVKLSTIWKHPCVITLTAGPEEKFMTIRWFEDTTLVPWSTIKSNFWGTCQFCFYWSPSTYEVQTPSDITVLNLKFFYRCFSARTRPERNGKMFLSKHKKLHAFRLIITH